MNKEKQKVSSGSAVHALTIAFWKYLTIDFPRIETKSQTCLTRCATFNGKNTLSAVATDSEVALRQTRGGLGDCFSIVQIQGA